VYKLDKVLMFFVLSKILFYILMPASWIASILLYSVFAKNIKRKKIALYTALGLFLFFGNFWMVNKLFLWYEPLPIPINELNKYETGIVLTGVMNPDKTPRDRVYFNKGADRVLHAVQLYKLGKIKKILITGGSGRVTGDIVSEAIELKKVFLMCDVPDSALIIEPNSRNTRENALYTKQVMDSLELKGKNLLITSAFHMPRSKGCFDKVGLQTDIFPVDYYGGNSTLTPDEWLIPTERSYVYWHILIHEWLGYGMYKLMGYI